MCMVNSVEMLQKQCLKQKLPPLWDKAISLKWQLLSETIKPKQFTFEDILHELKKKRITFKALYQEYQEIGSFLKDGNDIITKDLRRLDAEMLNSLHFNNTYPSLSTDRFRSACQIILRMLVRFELANCCTLEFNADYLQGMHEIVAFIMFVFVNQLDAFTIQELNSLKGCVSCKLEIIIADVYYLSASIIKYLLPVYLDPQFLQQLCTRIHQFIKLTSEEFYHQLEKEIDQLPPFFTFAQKSLKLFFIRDFDSSRSIQVFTQILQFKYFENHLSNTENSPYNFICFLTAQLYEWRFRNQELLQLQMFMQIFLEQNKMFPSSCDFEAFLNTVISNYCRYLKIDQEPKSETQMTKSVGIKDAKEVQEASDSNLQQFAQIQLQNITVITQLNKMLDQLNSEDVENQIQAINTAQQIQYLLEGKLLPNDLKNGKSSCDSYPDVYELNDFLAEDKRIERITSLFQ